MVYHVVCSDGDIGSGIAIVKTNTLKNLDTYSDTDYCKTTEQCELVLSGCTFAKKHFTYNSRNVDQNIIENHYFSGLPDFAKVVIGDLDHVTLIYGNRLEKTFATYLLLSFLKNILTTNDIVIIYVPYFVSLLCSGVIKPIDPHEVEILNFFINNKNIMIGCDFMFPDSLEECNYYYDGTPESELIPNIDPQKPFGYLCPELYEGTGYTPPDEPLTFRKITDEELMAKLQDSNSNGKPIEESIDEISRFRR